MKARVMDVYGRKHYVDGDFLANPAYTQIPLLNRNGRRLVDSSSYRPGMCTTIHRDNIKKVLP